MTLNIVFIACMACAAGLLRAAEPLAKAKVTRQPSVALAQGAVLHRFRLEGEDSVDFSVVQFAANRCTLRIVDQPVKGRAGSLGTAMTRIGAIAGVNGGFFSPSFEPLGLVVTQGSRVGSWQKSSLLGGVVMVKKGRLMLLWRDEFQDGQGISELLQTGPRLVNHGVAITGLESGRNRPRTFVATDDGGHWLIGVAQDTSLARLAELLATPGLVQGMDIDRALNFDGGRSTGLWLRTATGETLYEQEISTVRNFVAVVPKN